MTKKEVLQKTAYDLKKNQQAIKKLITSFKKVPQKTAGWNYGRTGAAVGVGMGLVPGVTQMVVAKKTKDPDLKLQRTGKAVENLILGGISGLGAGYVTGKGYGELKNLKGVPANVKRISTNLAHPIREIKNWIKKNNFKI